MCELAALILELAKTGQSDRFETIFAQLPPAQQELANDVWNMENCPCCPLEDQQQILADLEIFEDLAA